MLEIISSEEAQALTEAIQQLYATAQPVIPLAQREQPLRTVLRGVRSCVNCNKHSLCWPEDALVVSVPIEFQLRDSWRYENQRTYLKEIFAGLCQHFYYNDPELRARQERNLAEKTAKRAGWDV